MEADPNPYRGKTELSPIQRRIVQLRWPIVFIVVGAAAVHQALLFALLRVLPPAQHSLAQLAVYSITGVLVVWLGLRLLARAMRGQEQAEADLHTAYVELSTSHRRLQIIHEFSRRIATARDEQDLLEIAVQMPVAAVDATGAGLITFDDEGARANLEITWGLADPVVEALRRRVQTSLAVAGGCSQCLPLSPQITPTCPLRSPQDDATLCVPLGRAQTRLGILCAYLKGGATPDPEDLQTVATLAAEITAALEGARLRARQMAALYAVDRAAQEQGSLDALLDQVLATTVAGWNAQAGAILLSEPGTDTWQLRAVQGIAEEDRPAIAGLTRELACQTSPEQPVFLLAPPEGQPFASAIALRLQAEGRTVGALFVASQEADAFAEAQIDLMPATAGHIALAVRNAQLYDRLRETAVLEERYRLSREMHDGLAQTLSYLAVETERMELLVARGEAARLPEQLAVLREAIADAYAEVREAIDDLRLALDDSGGLSAALRTQADDFTRRTGLPVDCEVPGEPVELPPSVALNLLRIAQEALANVRRHAGASQVRVNLSRDNGHLELTIADDGQGFDPDLPQDRHHVGLASMRERVRSVRGQLTLASGPGQGTRITARVPLEGIVQSVPGEREGTPLAELPSTTSRGSAGLTALSLD